MFAVLERRCLFVTIAGLPNAGKSTLLNRVVGKRLAIVTPKVQTTRTQVRGILVRGNTQVIFTDSPGVFLAQTKLEKVLVKSAWSAIMGDDITLLLVDVRDFFKKMDRIKNVLLRLQRIKDRCILVINKIDLIKKGVDLNLIYKCLNSFYIFERIFKISALYGDGVFGLVSYLFEVAPLGDWFYEKNQITDSPMSFLSAEITREKLFLHLREELPYSIAVITEQVCEKRDESLIVKQLIFVLRDSHKKIILGKDGANIKRIGIEARADLQRLFECKVHLFLFLKVRRWIDHPEEYIRSA